MQCDERLKTISETEQSAYSPALMPRYGVRKANGGRQGTRWPMLSASISLIGEGSGVLAPNPSFLVYLDAFSSHEPEVHFARKRFRASASL
jgi:hypothetical protein